ncbi:hypothetical protein LhelvAHU1049_10000 [Lactobacillus helveticus]|nr:hypothetical protein LhelvAHU1049_10000 [Lactobacillus helveticus]
MGLSPVEAKEVLYQAIDYLGLGRVFPFFKATNDILTARGVDLPLASRNYNHGESPRKRRRDPDSLVWSTNERFC